MSKQGKVSWIRPIRAWSLALGMVSFCAPLPGADPILTEFMAENRSVLADADGAYPDWIEIFNAGPETLNLGGWFLTDTLTNLTRWTFPGTSLEPNGFLIVFASGKNRAVSGAELHTNFQLDQAGEYLALVRPDGTTIASLFSPAYPAQPEDKSYGLGMVVTPEPAPPAAPLDPATLFPYVHLRADRGVTTNAVNNTVTNWVDQSTNGFIFGANHPRAPANDPAVVAGPVAGTVAINFDGNDLLDSDANLQLFTSADAALTIFVVLKPASIPGTQRFVVNHAAGSGGDSFELGQDAGQVSPSGAWSIHRGSSQATSTGPASLMTGQYRVMTTEVLATGGAGQNVRFYTNGMLRPNTAGGWLSAGNYHTGSNPLAIGARVDNKGQGFNTITPDGYFQGDLAEVVVLRRTLSPNERAGVENFLLLKYGFTPPSRILFRPQVVPSQIGYFAAATPGSANGVTVAGFLAATRLEPGRGFYSNTVSVTMTCATPEATIRYTTNGALPTATVGVPYTGPLAISRTTVLRAAAFRSGYEPSRVDTHTYIFLEDVIRQPALPPGWPASGWGRPSPDYQMDPEVVTNAAYSGVMRPALLEVPTLSLVTDQSNLFHATFGLYNHPASEGDAWERPVSFEHLHPDPNADLNIQADAGMRIHGGVSRSDGVKLSFRIYFRARYGTRRLEFPLLVGNAATRFDNLVLRGQWNDGWHHTFDNNRTAVYVRDEWCRQAFAEMGHLSTIGNSMHLYLNGLYWGLYNPVEQINAAFVAEHLGGSEADYDVLKFNSGVEAADGDTQGWNTLLNLAQSSALNTPAAYEQIQSLLDMDNLIDFMIHFIFIGNEDGPAKNYYAYRRRSPPGRLAFVPWDNEWVLGHSFAGLDKLDVNVTAADADSSAARLFQRLRANAEFRVRFGDRVQKHFFAGGSLSMLANVRRYAALVGGITNAIVAESARWGDLNNQSAPGRPYTRNAEWAAENAFMMGVYYVQRPAIVLQQLRTAGLFPVLGAPSFSQHGGSVPAGFSLAMSHTNLTGAIVFTLDGSDPRLTGGAVAGSAISYAQPVVIPTQTLVRARVLSGTGWSPLTEAVFRPPQDLSGLMVNEIMYHPPAGGVVDSDEFEFLELKNVGANTVALGGLAFTRGITFTFAADATLSPGGILLLVRNPAQFAIRHPGVAVHGVYSGKLDNAGETLTLSHPLGGDVLSFSYGDSVPWPALADGQGFSLVPRAPNASADPNDAAHWRASTLHGGSPGVDDPERFIPEILINEVSSHAGPDGDFIELFNPTGTSVNLGGWFLSDNATQPAKFRILPHTFILPGGFLVVGEGQYNSNPGSSNSFVLDADGDQVFLFSADEQGNLTGYSHGFEFGAAPPGETFGRYAISTGEDHFPAQVAPTPGAANSSPRVGPVVIDEIHYHPDAVEDEFVELRNLTGSAVPCYDPGRPAIPWRLSGLDFLFPSNVTIAPLSRLLLTGIEPEIFRVKHSIPPEVTVLGPWLGNLQDSGERLALERPDETDTNGVTYLEVDVVRYNDKAPWPVAADGSGPSLQRKVSAAYGNDPANWEAAAATPGAAFAGGAVPAITRQPESRVVNVGEDVVFNVGVTGPMPLSYHWRFNGDAIPRATSPELTLRNVQASQAGQYSAVIYNPAGSAASAAATLTVRLPAFLVAPPQDRVVAVGRTTTFTVVALSDGPLRYQWERENQPILDATNATLLLTNVQLAHAGRYAVVIRNEYSSLISPSALLTVVVPPTIRNSPQNTTIVSGDTAILGVAADGSLPLSYRWRRGSLNLTNMILHSSNSVFKIPTIPAALNSTNAYSVVVTNLGGGQTSTVATVVVLADSDADRAPDVWEVAYGFNATNPGDGSADADQDGSLNWQEFIAGTDPTNALSYLRVDRLTVGMNENRIEFMALSNRTYAVFFADAPGLSVWQPLATLGPAPTNRIESVLDTNQPPVGRFYRLRTPGVVGE